MGYNVKTYAFRAVKCLSGLQYFTLFFRKCNYVLISAIFIDTGNHRLLLTLLRKVSPSHNAPSNHAATQLNKQLTHCSCLSWKPDCQ